jgi:hypothetical protein
MSDDVAVNAEASELPVQHVAGGAGFVADPKVYRVTELLDELGDSLRTIGDRAQGAESLQARSIRTDVKRSRAAYLVKASLVVP